MNMKTNTTDFKDNMKIGLVNLVERAGKMLGLKPRYQLQYVNFGRKRHVTDSFYTLQRTKDFKASTASGGSTHNILNKQGEIIDPLPEMVYDFRSK